MTIIRNLESFFARIPMKILRDIQYCTIMSSCLCQNTNCICLGVRNMERSVTFCRDLLGFQTDCTDSNPRVCFFNTPGTKFELYPLDLLSKDINPDDPPALPNGFGGITLTYNVDSKEKVDEVIALVRNAGGTIIKEPQEVFWGGYHGYFADPDGYYWEVAYGPDFKYDENGMLVF